MKHVKLYISLLLFCVQYGAFSVPISENEKEQGYEVIRHNYRGHVNTRTSATNETIARWTISGDLYEYKYPDYFYVKLDNVKTSVFNGQKSDLRNVQEKPVPPEAEIIQQMFAAKFEKNYSVSLFFKENEPEWSINMKKGLYNFLHYEYEVSADDFSEILRIPESYVWEKSVFGECRFRVTQEVPLITREMKGWDCIDIPVIHETNYRRAPGSKDLYDMLDYQYSKVLTLKKRGESYKPHTIVQKTSMEYKTSPSALYSQIIEQEQSYEVSEVYISTEKINPSEFTVKTDLIYKSSDIRLETRHDKDKNSTVLAKKYLDNYNEMLKRFNYSTPEKYMYASIYDMYQILLLLDVDGFKEFDNATKDGKHVYELGYFSLLPYVGTKASVEFLTNFMKTEQINVDLGLAQRIFATLPRYIRDPTDDILIQMEPFINHETAKFKSLKNSALLSFASTVGYACQKGSISKKYKIKYVEMFHNDFLEKEDYEDRMVKLMGLVNMVPCLNRQLINSITTNTSESSHLRALALVGFKESLKKYARVYKIYWPIVEKDSEPFEVRVRALDLLLSSKLTEDQFNSIVNKYSKSINDPKEKQLANYVLSTLHSIKETTGYSDYLGELALEALKDNKIPIHPKTLATGYYRLAFTDAALNFGSLFDIRFITNPMTNIVDTIQLSFNSFANSVDFGTYMLYLKFTGLFDWGFIHLIMKKTSEVSSVPELLKLLKEHNFELKSPVNDIHVEIVLFIDYKVVFTRHFSIFEDNDIKKLGPEIEKHKNIFKYASFPILEFAHMPSDFGTPIQFHNYLRDVTTYDPAHPNGFYYRSSSSFQTWFDIHNPLADTYISNFKYYGDEKNISFNIKPVSLFPPTFKWFNEKDSYTQFWENMMGTMIEGEAVKEYYPKYEVHSELDTNYYSSWTNGGEPLGFNADISSISHNERTNISNIMSEYSENDLHQYNVDAFPYAAPILYYVDIFNYKFWLRSELSRGTIKTWPSNGYDNISETVLQFDFSVPGSSNFGNSIMYRGLVKSTVKNAEDNEPLSNFNMTTMMYLDTDYQDPKNETINHKIFEFLEFYMKYNSTKPENSFKICGYGDIFYPNRRSEMLSLLPFESITGETSFVTAKNIDDDEDCIPEYSYIFKEVYSSNNIEQKLENEQFLKDYEKCSADSKGLKFTAPTEECRKVSSRITEYDNYKVYLKVQKYNETVMDLTEPTFEYSRLDENTIELKFMNETEWFKSVELFELNNYNMYHPKPTVDPAIYAYSKKNSGIFGDARSTCTITPSIVEQFSGKYIPNQRNKWLAFAECFNVSSTGLNGRTIDDKHVGFTFYSFDNIVEATAKDGKAYITLNGKNITEFYWADDLSIKIYFLDEDVVYIMDKNVEIYYNTEYVEAKVNAIYPKILCGICTQ